MADNQPPRAHLQGLPPELRNEIYHLVAVESTDIHFIGSKFRRNSELENAVAPHPLSQTCKQIQQEFEPVYVNDTIIQSDEIYLHLDNFNLKPVRRFLSLSQKSDKMKLHFNGKPLFISLHVCAAAFDSVRALPRTIYADAYEIIRKQTPEYPFSRMRHEARFRYNTNWRSKRKVIDLSCKNRMDLQKKLDEMQKGHYMLKDREKYKANDSCVRDILFSLYLAVLHKHREIQRPINEARKEREQIKARELVIKQLKAEGWTLTPPEGHGQETVGKGSAQWLAESPQADEEDYGVF